MSAAALLLTLAMASVAPPLAPCAPVVRIRGAPDRGSVVDELVLPAARGSGPWEIFAPIGSRAAVAYRLVRGVRERSSFEDEIPDEGHVLYGGPPALTIPRSWRRRPLFVRVFSHDAILGCIRAAPLAYVIHNEPRAVPLYLYFGLLGGTALTMLVLFAVSGEPFIGWYLAYLASLVLYQLFRNDFLWPLGWPFGPWHGGAIEYVLWGPNVALYAQFARSFLQTSRYAPRIDRLLLVGIAALLAYLPLVVFLRRTTGIDLNPHSVLPIAAMLWVSVLVIVATIGRARAGYRPARYFLLSYPILLVFVCVAVWQYVAGAHAGIGVYGAEIGTGSECVLLAFAIGDRLRLERTLGRVLSTIDAIVLRLGRDGSILFATANIESALGVSNDEIVGKRIAAVLGARDAALVTKVARSAIRTSANAGATMEIALHNRRDELRTYTATLHVERDRSGAIAEIQLALRPSKATSAATENLYLSVYRGVLLLGASPVAVTGRELELLCYLALHRAPIASSQLAEAIWPDRDARAAASALQTTISRLRKKLPPDTILAERRRYALGEKLRTDIEELRSAVRARDIGELERLRACLAATIPVTLRRCEWFAEFDLWLEGLRRDAFVDLGEAMLARGELPRALAIADDLRRLAPFDESGYLLAIRAHLAANDPAAARRVYADCRRAIERELGLSPSPQFEECCRSLRAGAPS